MKPNWTSITGRDFISKVVWGGGFLVLDSLRGGTPLLRSSTSYIATATDTLTQTN